MKKKFTFLMAALMLLMMAIPMMGWADDAVFSHTDFSGQGSSGSGGDLTGATKGSITITGKGNGNTNYLQVYSSNYLIITPNNGATITGIELTATNSTYIKTWSASDNTGVTISDNKATWSGSSTSAITLTNTASAQARITGIVVTYTPAANVDVTGVTLSPTTATLTLESAPSQLTATVTPDNATNKTVTWSSGTPSVATVSSTGLVTPVATGTTIITATATNGTADTSDDKTATCTVTVNSSVTYAVALADGTADASHWTISPTSAAAGATITISYTGERTITSVSAVKKPFGLSTFSFATPARDAHSDLAFTGASTEKPVWFTGTVETHNTTGTVVYDHSHAGSYDLLSFNGVEFYNGSWDVPGALYITGGLGTKAAPFVLSTTSSPAPDMALTETSIGEKTWTITLPTSDVEIKVLMPYTVTLADNGSELTEASGGAGVTLPERNTIGLYEFAGWSATNVATETTTAPTIITTDEKYYPTSDITLYPVYTRTEGSSAQEYTPSVTISDYATAHSWSNSLQYETVTLDENITATATFSGTGTTYTGTYNSSNNDWRIYQTDGGTVTISTSSGVLSSVKFTFTINNSGTLNYNNSAVTSGTAVDISGTSATFTVSKTGSGSNGQIRITAIEVKYTTGGGSTTYYNSGYYMPISAWTTTPTVGGWYLIAAPVGTTAAAGIGNLIGSGTDAYATNTYDLFRFNQEAEKEWENWNKSGDHYQFGLEEGSGYLYANIANVTLVFFDQSTSAQTTYDVNLTKSDGNPHADLSGWNLIGNPFSDTATINKSFYRMNAGHTEILATTSSGKVNPVEGIFVQADDDQEVVTFTKSAKRAAESNDNSNLVIDLSSEMGNVIDRAIVRFDEGETLPKFQLRDNSTKLYIPINGKDYAIVNANNQDELPMNFRASVNGNYTLSVSDLHASNYLHLIDNIAGTDIDLLANPSYTFNAKSDDYESRFRLVFSANNENQNENEKDFAFFSNGQLIVTGEGTLQVVDMMGRIVSTEIVNGTTSKTIDAKAGVYVLRLINGENVKTQKIVVR